MYLPNTIAMDQSKNSMGTIIGLLVAFIAIVGTQAFGWEWGSGQFAPTIIGVVAAGIAVLLAVRRW